MVSNDVSEEQWRPIPGWEGLYDVSDHGRVRSYHWQPPKICKPERRGGPGRTYSYWSYNLTRGCYARQKKIFAHRLVALAFIPNPLRLPTVNHIDGDKLNNRVTNLEWASQRDNSLHAVKMGLLVGQKGGAHPRAKLTEQDVQEIRARAANDERPAQIAEDYPVGANHISQIIRREAWGHVA